LHQVIRIPPPHEVASLVGSKVDDFRWHSTERNLGSIRGIKSNLVIIATDGNLGAFVDSSGKLFLGHIQMFSGRVRVKSLSG
jgi:hypothetical protein